MSFMDAGVEHRDDVRMRQRRDDFGFALEPRAAIRIVRESGWQYLDRDVAIESRVARAIDLAHPAFAELGHHVVRTDGFPDHRRGESYSPVRKDLSRRRKRLNGNLKVS